MHGSAVGTKVSGHCTHGGLPSEVAYKRGFTVVYSVYKETAKPCKGHCDLGGLVWCLGSINKHCPRSKDI